MMHRNKVLRSYFGSKNQNGVYQFIINHFCKHSTYIEGFLGSGIIYQMKKQAKQSIGFEIDSTVIDKWNTQASHPDFQLINRSFIDEYENVSRRLDLANTLVYIDPPYLHSTRSSCHRYRHELTTEQHIDLLALGPKSKRTM